jgi:dipeptidyl aminopeptidase/acylaminoacyl peptidase
MKHLRLLTLVLVISLSAKGQHTKEDYVRADSLVNVTKLVYHEVLTPHWIDSTYMFWYKIRLSPDKTEYVLVNAENQTKNVAFDHQRLSDAIHTKLNVKASAEDLQLTNLHFSADTSITFEKKDSIWKCNLANYGIQCVGPVKHEKYEHWGKSIDELTNGPVRSPDQKKEAFIRNYNLYVRELKSGEEKQLSFDGSEGDLYSSYIVWSPDSRFLTTNKVRVHKKRYIYFVESSPKDQLQPKLHKTEYLKPGDALPIKKPSLFNVEEGKQVAVDTRPFENQFDILNVKWWDDSSAFTFEFNQRGHQKYQVVEVDATTGKVKILVNEQSDTFIDYSGKHFRYDIDKTREIIWASERDGWNHLYLIDGKTAQVKNQVIHGNWVVRNVIHVDDNNRTILFAASGKNKGEDPYFIHYYRVGFNGKGLKELTPEQMQHEALFSKDYKYFIDSYSTPETPPVAVLRSSSNGHKLMTLEEADISDLKAEGWKFPEPFVAKGRDGKTDIWGNIYRPVNFDPSKSYPIIEYIYAGPQGAFVEKSFRPYMWAFSSLAELGFIVVQIDGMGTSNRSKAFHDVCFKNLKDAGFPDRIKWIKAAAEKYPYMDTTRVGIFGGSAGGQNALAAVLFHPEFYDAAVASCGCHDNRMDKMWWNEQWMGYPIGPQYAACSNVVNAHCLQGDLMLIVGEMDDNVDPSSTIQVADALIKANKDFELVVLPGSNHTLGGQYGERKRREFFVKVFYGELPPHWNSK